MKQIKLTPSYAAKLVMRNRNAVIDNARIEVTSLSRIYKSGPRRRDRRSIYYFADGAVKAKREDHHGVPKWNGICWICGKVHVGKVITRLGRDDPEAGRELTSAEKHDCGWLIDGLDWRAKIYKTCFTHACPQCAKEHKLREVDIWATSDKKNKVQYLIRRDPELSQFRNKPEIDIFIDVRNWQSGIAANIDVVENYRDDERVLSYSVSVPKKVTND